MKGAKGGGATKKRQPPAPGTFEASKTWAGPKQGMVFKAGPYGQGYYLDSKAKATPRGPVLSDPEFKFVKSKFSVKWPRKGEWTRTDVIDFLDAANLSIPTLRNLADLCQTGKKVVRGCNKRDVLVAIIAKLLTK